MVHQYKLNAFNIVLDTCSGAVHVVDEVAYDVIEMYQTKSAEIMLLQCLKQGLKNPSLHQHIPRVKNGLLQKETK